MILLAVASSCANNQFAARIANNSRHTSLLDLQSSEGEIQLYAGWPVTEGSAGGGRYSPLKDINRDNVAQLEIAWVYRHGNYRSGGILPDKYFKGTAFESTPIVVEGRLIFTTPYYRVIALDPTTRAELWIFDPKIDRDRRFANMLINRGVAYWHDPNE